MTSKMIYLNASITLSKLPIMMQTQSKQPIWDEEGRPYKKSQPCLVPTPNTTICNSWLSHNNCQTEMWSQNLDDWNINLCKREQSNNWLELDVKSINLTQCFNNSIQTSNYDANTNLSNQYEMRRDDLKKFATLSRANAEYNYLPQLTLTL